MQAAMAFTTTLSLELQRTPYIRQALRRALQNDQARWEAVNQMFARFDESIGELFDLDKEHHVLQLLSPHGRWQGSRKQLSYFGGVRRNRDIPLAEDDDPNAVRELLPVLLLMRFCYSYSYYHYCCC